MAKRGKRSKQTDNIENEQIVAAADEAVTAEQAVADAQQEGADVIDISSMLDQEQTEERVEVAAAPMLDENGEPIEGTEAAPFDESQLLELAQNEGLVDGQLEQEAAELEGDAEIDMPQPEQDELMASMETILFMSDKPVTLSRLRSTINTDVKMSVYRKLFARLRDEFAQDKRGIEIAETAQGYQLRTKPHMSNVLRKMVKTQPLKLSGTNMEVLAIVAYKQPVTKDEIDQIRGVDSGYVLRNLMEKRLVKISGRSDLPGRPMLYATTHEFLELFNLKDTQSLPPLHEVEAMVAASEVGAEEKSKQAFQEFGEMIAKDQQILFDDSKLDEELEAIRNEIASIPTSTSFIDEQKAKEKHDAKLAELAEQGLTLDADGNVVPLGTVASTTVFADAELAIQVTPQVATEAAEVAEHAVVEEHAPSPELLAEAEAATAERHNEMLETTVVESEVALVNAEALADAVSEAKFEQEIEEASKKVDGIEI